MWVALIVGVTLGRRIPRLVAAGPLPRIGRISYGIYLYHWPVFLLFRDGRFGLDGPGQFLARLAVTFTVAGLSSRFIEEPIRRGAFVLPSWPRAAPAGAIAAVVVVFAATIVSSNIATDDTGGVGVYAAAPSVTQPTGPASPPDETEAPGDQPSVTSTTPTDPNEPIPPVDGTPNTDNGPPVSVDGPSPETPNDASPASIPRLLVIGDSTAEAQGLALRDAGVETGRAAVLVRGLPGCTILPYMVAHVRPGYTYRPNCVDVSAEAARLIAADPVDAVVVFIGSAQLLDAEFPGLSGVHSILETAIQGQYRAALAGAVRAFSELGVPILWADVPVPVWDLDAFGTFVGAAPPGHGTATSNDPARSAALRALDQAGMAASPNVLRWSYSSAVAAASVRKDIRVDGLHVGYDAGVALAKSTLFDVLESSYRAVRARPGATLVAPRDTAWDRPTDQ